MKLFPKFILIFALFCTSCYYFANFDTSATLENKWKKISSWVPGSNRYTILIDVNRIVQAEFGQQLISPDAGIMVVTNDLTFIGGNFKKETFLANLKTEINGLTEEIFLDKTIYTAPSSKSSFVFLEKYLICQGQAKEIKNLITKHNEKKIVPPQISTDHAITGLLNYKSEIKIYADIDKNVDLIANAAFANKNEAKLFSEELNGIKTIKTIELVDEPRLSDILDQINIERLDKIVTIRTTLDMSTAKKLIKRYFL